MLRHCCGGGVGVASICAMAAATAAAEGGLDIRSWGRLVCSGGCFLWWWAVRSARGAPKRRKLGQPHTPTSHPATGGAPAWRAAPPAGYSSTVLHPQIRLLDGPSDELRERALDTLCSVALAVGPDFAIFLPTIKKVGRG